jgi:branched-chain amino acid transport system substrate-binding protein
MGDQMLGTITSGSYSAAHDSALNKAYVSAFEKASGFRPDFVSVGAYDGLHLIYESLKKTNGNAEGDTLLGAMKGMAGKARAARFRSTRRPATSCRTSTSARSKR